MLKWWAELTWMNAKLFKKSALMHRKRVKSSCPDRRGREQTKSRGGMWKKLFGGGCEQRGACQPIYPATGYTQLRQSGRAPAAAALLIAYTLWAAQSLPATVACRQWPLLPRDAQPTTHSPTGGVLNKTDFASNHDLIRDSWLLSGSLCLPATADITHVVR